MSVAYLDTSALVKLVVRESESAALQDWIRAGRDTGTSLTTSTLATVELTRAARRHSAAAARTAADLLPRLDHITMSSDVLRDAARLEPATLRTLDAIHLASARLVAASLSAFVAYDERLLDAARTAGLAALVPR